MQCPYCSNEMEAGIIDSTQEIAWKRRRFLFGRAMLHPGSVVLAPYGFMKGSCVKAHLCRPCGKVIIDCMEAMGPE